VSSGEDGEEPAGLVALVFGAVCFLLGVGVFVCVCDDEMEGEEGFRLIHNMCKFVWVGGWVGVSVCVYVPYFLLDF
jgi:hypothetical protein